MQNYFYSLFNKEFSRRLILNTVKEQRGCTYEFDFVKQITSVLLRHELGIFLDTITGDDSIKEYYFMLEAGEKLICNDFLNGYTKMCKHGTIITIGSYSNMVSYKNRTLIFKTQNDKKHHE